MGKADQTALVDCLVAEQNCGFVNFEGEKLYFYGSQLIGCHLSELNVGDRMNFDIVFNPRTNKFLAKSVRRVAQVKKNIGYFLPVVQASIQEASNTETGKVTEICGHSHGFIESEVFFHYSNLVGTHISELSVGSSLSFSTKMNGSQKVATNVRLEPVEEVNKNLGHFQMMQVSQVADEATFHRETRPTTGKVSELCGHTHGFIDNDVFFHYSTLVGTHISELSVGSSLSFNTKMNGNQKVATNVRIEPVEGVNKNLGHFQMMTANQAIARQEKPTT